MKFSKPSKIEMILASVGVAACLSLFAPMPMNVNGQNPVVQRDEQDGYLYVGYDFDRDGKLDRVDSHFYLGDQTIPYHSFSFEEDSPHFKSLQDKYSKQ